MNANSFYIPRILSCVMESTIAKCFNMLQICIVDRIEIVMVQDVDTAETYGCFVYVREWYNTITADNFRMKLQNETKNCIVYDDPHYWIILPNQSEISQFPIPKHTDLEFVTYEGISVKIIENVFNALDIGCIHSISMCTIQEMEMTNCNYNLPWGTYKWYKKVRVTIHFEYWYRSLGACMFVNHMTNNNMPYVSIPVFDGNLTWKVFESRNPPITDGINPYIWFNPDNNNKSLQSQTIYNTYLEPKVNHHIYYTEDGEISFEKPYTYHQKDESYYYDYEDLTYKYYINHSPITKTLNTICEDNWNRS